MKPRPIASVAGIAITMLALVLSLFSASPAAAQPVPPVITLNGSVGPVTLEPGPVQHTISVTGLTSTLNFEINEYLSANCEGIPVDLPPGIPTATGTWENPIFFESTGSWSFSVLDQINGLSNCVTVYVVEAEPTETPTPSPTDTPPTPTATATSPSALPGSAIITVVTSDGSAIPDDTRVCVGLSCQSLDDIAAAAAPSGTSATYTDLTPDSYPLAVFIGAAQVFASTIDIIADETTAVTITLDGAAPTEPAEGNVDPDGSDDGGGTTDGDDSDDGPRDARDDSETADNEDGTNDEMVVTTLPATGSGHGTSLEIYLLLLLSAGLIATATCLARRQRRVG